MLFENQTIVYRYDEDGYLFVVGGAEENEVVLHQVMTCWYDALEQLVKNNCEKKVLHCPLPFASAVRPLFSALLLVVSVAAVHPAHCGTGFKGPYDVLQRNRIVCPAAYFFFWLTEKKETAKKGFETSEESCCHTTARFRDNHST